MSNSLIANSSITINAPAAKVWQALTRPELIKQYFSGVDVVTDWTVGSSIVYKGVWQGRSFEDKGTVLKVEPLERLVVTHWSPLSGLPDSPENYHTVTYALAEHGRSTEVTISNDNNPDEQSKAHSEQNWASILKSLKQLLER